MSEWMPMYLANHAQGAVTPVRARHVAEALYEVENYPEHARLQRFGFGIFLTEDQAWQELQTTYVSRAQQMIDRIVRMAEDRNAATYARVARAADVVFKDRETSLLETIRALEERVEKLGEELRASHAKEQECHAVLARWGVSAQQDDVVYSLPDRIDLGFVEVLARMNKE